MYERGEYMKKLLIIFIALILAFAGCANEPSEATGAPEQEVTEAPVEETEAPVEESAEPVELSVLVPFGSPALSMSGLIINEDTQEGSYSLGNNSYKLEIVNGADPLVAAFTSQSHDVIIAPTNLGAKFYSAGIPYKYAGAVVYGNLYLASLNELAAPADLVGKEIVAFSQNATPDVVLQTILSANDLTDKVTVRYVGSVSEAQGELLAGTADAALLAEPILSVTKTKAELNVLDLQTEWATSTGLESYPQAGIFIKADLIDNNFDVVGEFLELVQTSIRQANEDPAATAQSLAAIEFGLPAKVIESAIPNSHLVFQSALDSRQDLVFYYNKIMELNPNLIGGALPDDKYYQ